MSLKGDKDYVGRPGNGQFVIVRRKRNVVEQIIVRDNLSFEILVEFVEQEQFTQLDNNEFCCPLIFIVIPAPGQDISITHAITCLRYSLRPVDHFNGPLHEAWIKCHL